MENEKIEKIADILDLDSNTITLDTQLDTIGWDSMGILSVIALAKTNGKVITGDVIRGFKTIGDIVSAAF